jgi:hypothetical protein
VIATADTPAILSAEIPVNAKRQLHLTESLWSADDQQLRLTIFAALA